MEAQPCRPRVLIVDDATENIQQLADMLVEEWTPVSATNGVQALKLANDDPAPDLILLDITMPGMNGYEVCARLKAQLRTRDIPVIFVTAPSEKHEEHKGLALGAADYITKPFTPCLVKARIRHQLDIRRYRGQKEDSTLSMEDATVGDVESELVERTRAQKELTLLNEALEERLAKCLAQLASVREELQEESRNRAQDRLEIGFLHEELRRQKSSCENATQELESLSFSISHDLRAPLRHVMGFTSVLKEDYGDQLDQQGQTFLGSITKAAAKLEAQVEALLGLSRISRQPLTPMTVDLTLLAHECASALQAGEPERKGVFNIAEGLEVTADPVLLRTVLEHLLGNAWKFTAGRELAAIEVGRTEEGVTPVFFVRDNGAGFEMRYADRLFGAFQRMHRECDFPGIGIGLATAQRIIRRHGGRIWADAKADGGATFFFTLGE